jgi:hypothetical protein
MIFIGQMILNQTIGDCLTNYFMKIVLNLIYMLSIIGISFSQSKKEQIQILNARLDSLKTIEINESKSFIQEKNNLTKEFNILQSQNELLTDSIQTVQNQMMSLDNELRETRNENIRLKNELKRIKDSIDLFWKNQTVQFIDSPLFSMSEEEIIHNMNITYEEIVKETQEEWGVTDLSSSNKDVLIKVIGNQYFEQDNKTYCMSVLGIDNKFGFGPGPICAGVMVQAKNNWVLIDKIFEFPPTSSAEFTEIEKFRKIGKKIIGVETSQFLYPGKLSIINNSIFAYIENKIIKVYGGFIHSFNPDNNTYNVVERDFELLIIDNGNEFFDFKVNEIEKGKTPISYTLKLNPNTMRYE